METFESRIVFAVEFVALSDPALVDSLPNGDADAVDLSSDGRWLAFASDASNYSVRDTNGEADIFLKDLQTDEVHFVSAAVDPGWQHLAGNGRSSFPVVSKNGRYVAFQSEASNLVAGDTNGRMDIFVREMSTGILRRVSENAVGTPGIGYALNHRIDISDDGRYIGFISDSPDLVAGAPTDQSNIFIKDMETGAISFVAMSANERVPPGTLLNLSGDGRWLGYETRDTTTNAFRAYVMDLSTMTSVMVGTNAQGEPGDHWSRLPSLSHDGRFVVFYSRASNLGFSNPDSQSELVWKDLVTGQTRLVSISEEGVRATIANHIGTMYSISQDGRYVSFWSTSANLADSSSEGTMFNVFKKDMLSGKLTVLSRKQNGSLGNDASGVAFVSADGQKTAFLTNATDLLEGDTNGFSDVVVHDETTGSLHWGNRRDRASLHVPSGIASFEAVSPDGARVVYSSNATTLVSGTTPSIPRTYVRDMDGQGSILAGVLTSGEPINAPVSLRSLARGGNLLLMLTQEVSNAGPAGLYLRDLDTGITSFLSSDFDGILSEDGQYAALRRGGSIYARELATGTEVLVGAGTSMTISDDGENIGFQSFGGVYRWTRSTGAIVRADMGIDGQPADATFVNPVPRISGDGQSIAFLSEATNLVSGDTNGDPDYFVHNFLSGQTVRVSTDSNGNQSDGLFECVFVQSNNGRITISANGRFVAFHACSAGLTPIQPDAGLNQNAFVKDLVTGHIFPLSISMYRNASGGLQEAYSASFFPILSDDGRYLSFLTNGGFFSNDWVGYNTVVRTFNPLLMPETMSFATGSMSESEASPTSRLVTTMEFDSEDPYELEFALLENGDQGKFYFEGNQLYLRAEEQIDFETQSSYSLHVRATNLAGMTLDRELTIEVLDQPDGTVSDDTFTVTLAADQFVVQRANGSGRAQPLGVYPRNRPLQILGAGGNDTLRVLGSSSDDHFRLSSEGLVLDGSTIELHSVENVILVGGAGQDRYQLIPSDTLGSVTLDEAGGGIDTLDFSESLAMPIHVDLANALPQAVTPTLSLRLLRNNSFENVIGTPWNDTILGNALSNHLEGRGGDDRLEGMNGVDLLEGGFGNDILRGGTGNDTYRFDADRYLGNDTLEDSSGIDWLDFSATETVGVVLDLASSLLQALNANLGLTLQAGTVVEGVRGTQMADTLYGNTAANTLEGQGGDDTIDGRAGNDTYLFDADLSLGTDTIADGGGSELLDFSATTGAGIEVDLQLTTHQMVHGNLALVLASASSIEKVSGSQADDTLRGNGLANTLIGNGGNDRLEGRAGNDVYPFVANSQLGTDTIDDLSGVDVFDFSGTTSQGISVDLVMTNVQVVHPTWLNVQLVSSSMMENVVGTRHADTLRGNTLANKLVGGSGDDWLEGREGNDLYEFDADLVLGNDTVNDIGGIDTLSYSLTTTQGVAIDLGSLAGQVVTANHGLTLMSASMMETVVGGSQNDMLLGNTLDNILTGGLGNDWLEGGAGDDTYRFDADLMLGTDTISDSEGFNDTLDFTGTTSGGIVIDLGLTTAQLVRSGMLSLVIVGGDSIEHVVGSSQADTVVGNGRDNMLLGMSGSDTLEGRGGRDLLLGGLGSDVLHGGAGEDLLIAGTTTYDQNFGTLRGIQTEWSSTRTYLERVSNLRLGTMGLASLVSPTSVKRESVANTMEGGEDLDWYFANLQGSGSLDVIMDLTVGELLDELI